MKEFIELQQIFDRLMGPGGCPFDRRQTMKSMRRDLLEEVYEVIQAIDLDDDQNMCEELGDVAACVVFLGKIAEKERRFSMQEALRAICDKLIRRHPHVFGESAAETDEELSEQWERIKREERGGYVPESILDGICSSLPALSRAQEVVHRMARHEVAVDEDSANGIEEEVGEALWHLVTEAQKRGIDAEVSLRRHVARKERTIRQQETAYSTVA